LKQLSNISQLRNLWLRSSDERLSEWRDFRLGLQELYGQYDPDSDCNDDILLSSLSAIDMWWQHAPLVSVAIDPYNYKFWPSVWEIVHQGECCKYSKGLAMAYTMYYMDPNAHVTVERVYDQTHNDEYFMATFNGQYGLNTPYSPVLDLKSVDSIISKESHCISSEFLNI
jgi:hypothetical protein